MLSRTAVACAIAAGLAFGLPAASGTEDPYALAAQLLSVDKNKRKLAARELIRLDDRSMVPGLVDAVFYTPAQNRSQIYKVLTALTGEKRSGYYEWIEFVGEHDEIEPREGYYDWKVALLKKIDPDYRKIFYSGAPLRIRLEEVVSGGVRLAGLPAIDDPPTVSVDRASFMRKRERIFGVFLGGEARAYPVKVLSWHEMLNDVVGGEPVTLSFCTLCGSGILYSARTPAGGAYRFDTSGLLYRSNKLMVDRNTYTLWSNLTGEAVIGRLAQAEARLEVLSATLTTWEDWVKRYPDTRVLDVPHLEDQFGSRFGFDYRPGAADQARTGVEFPVWAKSDRLDRDEEVYAMKINGAAKVYPVDDVLTLGLIHDELGGQELVLVGDSESGAIRAFDRAGRRFQRGSTAGVLVDESGAKWRVGEEGLVPEGGGESETLARVPGHVAFWFGWYAFYPQTEVYGSR